MSEVSERDCLNKSPFPRKPFGAPSAYYLWNGCLVTRRMTTRAWIKALEAYLKYLEDQRE